MTFLNKQEEVTRVKSLIAGTAKHLSNVASLTVGSVSYTTTQLTTLMVSFLTLFSDVDAAGAVYKAKLLAQRNQAPSLRAILRMYQAIILVQFANSPDVLADFGLTPRKVRAPLTAEQKAQAVAKRNATRKARHTMGKRAKLAVKGEVAVPVNGTSATPANAGGGTTPKP